MPPGTLCGAFQELCRCLAPLLKRGGLLDITMMNMVEKDPVTPPVPTERTSTLEKKPEPQEEEPTTLPAPNRQQALEPEEASHFGELAIVQGRLPPAHPRFTGS